MEQIAQSAFAGVIAALTATFILGAARLVRQWMAKRREVGYIRAVMIEGRKRVMAAKDTFHKDMNATSSENELRAAQYNLMLKKLDIALGNWTTAMSHNQKKDIFDATDWYHTDSLQATRIDGRVVYVYLPDGKWPTSEMSMEAAEKIFGRLQSIKWLDLKSL